MKFSSTSAILTYNSIESWHSCRTSSIRAKGSNKRPFLLLLDFILVNTTSILWMNRLQRRTFAKQKIKNCSQIYQRFLFSLFGTSIVSQMVERKIFNSVVKVCKIALFFRTGSNCFSPVNVSNALCSWFLKVVVYGFLARNHQSSFHNLFYIWQEWFQF